MTEQCVSVVSVYAGEVEYCGKATLGGDLCPEHLALQIAALEKVVSDKRKIEEQLVELRSRPQRHHVTLSNGRQFYAYGDRLSLDAEGKLGYGHNGGVDETFSPGERAEIAHLVIARWLKWVTG